MDLREVTEFIKDASKFLFGILVLVIIFTFIVAFQPIAGNSMNPTLAEGDVVAVSRFSKNYKRNDIIVFKDKAGKSYIKRIIGMPGEKIDYLNGLLYVNNNAYRETYLDSSIVTSNFLFVDICSLEDCPDGKIPENYYLVLGDNRPESADSRDPSIGLVKNNQIKGIVLFRVWPLNKFGSI